MREIKFRIWNAYAESMHDWDETVAKNKIHLLNAKNPSYKVMQFIDKKDHDGVDIYEGDILKIEFYNDFHNEWVSIELDDDALSEAIVEVYWDIDGYWMFSEADKTWYFPQSLDDCATIEVIGNIHQNPELLLKG